MLFFSKQIIANIPGVEVLTNILRPMSILLNFLKSGFALLNNYKFISTVLFRGKIYSFCSNLYLDQVLRFILTRTLMVHYPIIINFHASGLLHMQRL